MTKHRARFAEKVALVTGAGQGIGAAIAKRLASEGCKTCLIDRDAAGLEAVAREIGSAGGEASSFVADVAKKAAVQDTVNAVVARYGKLDILVNNAGIIRDGFISKISEEDWDAVLDVNLKGPFFFCQAVFPFMKASGAGRIVNIVSRAWLGNAGQSNYSASKGGLVSLTRTLALEFARFQIGVNAVAPGLIDTPMTQGMPAEARERLLKMQPTGKMGTVEDIAAAVAFLSSDEAGFITGQVLHVDGGKSCGLLSL
ncbi:MAG: SDR family oxidoreductase [Deltaproteobacteria bacterium]|nr:SDR family oxidoreductase [Deltaproteobacteria bacterium]